MASQPTVSFGSPGGSVSRLSAGESGTQITHRRVGTVVVVHGLLILTHQLQPQPAPVTLGREEPAHAGKSTAAHPAALGASSYSSLVMRSASSHATDQSDGS
jgi:hypothetical protein